MGHTKKMFLPFIRVHGYSKPRITNPLPLKLSVLLAGLPKLVGIICQKLLSKQFDNILSKTFQKQ